MGHWKSNPKREIHSIRGLTQKRRKEREKAQVNNLTSHLKELKKEQQINPQLSKKKEIIKIRAEINEIGSKNMIQKINKSKSWFCEKIHKIYKPLTRLIKKERERTQINKVKK